MLIHHLHYFHPPITPPSSTTIHQETRETQKPKRKRQIGGAHSNSPLSSTQERTKSPLIILSRDLLHQSKPTPSIILNLPRFLLCHLHPRSTLPTGTTTLDHHLLSHVSHVIFFSSWYLLHPSNYKCRKSYPPASTNYHIIGRPPATHLEVQFKSP